MENFVLLRLFSQKYILAGKIKMQKVDSKPNFMIGFV